MLTSLLLVSAPWGEFSSDFFILEMTHQPAVDELLAGEKDILNVDIIVQGSFLIGDARWAGSCKMRCGRDWVARPRSMHCG